MELKNNAGAFLDQITGYGVCFSHFAVLFLRVTTARTVRVCKNAFDSKSAAHHVYSAMSV